MEWRRSSWILALLLILSGPVIAEGPINEDEWEDLRKELNYEEEVPEEQEIGSGTAFLYGFFATLFSSGLMVFGSILVIVMIGLLIYFLIKNSRKPNFKRSFKSAEELIPDEPDSRSSYTDLWEAFNRAKSAGNYRECIRLIHQVCIKNLSEAGFFQLHPDKTNWEYVSELSNPALADDFSKLTADHELIWYGDAPLDKAGFLRLEKEFNSFLKSEELGK
jgi:hypothetical protein